MAGWGELISPNFVPCVGLNIGNHYKQASLSNKFVYNPKRPHLWDYVIDGLLLWKGVFCTFTPLRSVIPFVPIYKTILSLSAADGQLLCSEGSEDLALNPLTLLCQNQLPQTPRTLPESWEGWEQRREVSVKSVVKGKGCDSLLLVRGR